jgi:hypothetical protein
MLGRTTCFLTHVKVPPKCRLCLREGGELQNSHFISAAIHTICFRALRQGSKDYALRPTFGPMVDKLLCRDCERRLNEMGEAWTIKYMARRNTFRMRTLLESHQAVHSNARFRSIVAIPGLESNKLAYFALGIFWKASVHQWYESITDRVIKPIFLGKGQELVRRFLLGELTWPKGFALLVTISRLEKPPLTFQPPVEGYRDSAKSFEFTIPGLTFHLTSCASLPNDPTDFYPHATLLIANNKSHLLTDPSHGARIG